VLDGSPQVRRDVATATIFGFLYMGAHWRHLANTAEPSVCGGDAALCPITLTTCIYINILDTASQRVTNAVPPTAIQKLPITKMAEHYLVAKATS